MTNDEPTIAGAPRDMILEANTYEAHAWLAHRAIDAEELTLAITHLRLAIELEEAIIARGDRALVERAGRDAWQKASSGAREQALGRLDTMLRENTVNVPLVGQTRDERPDRVYPTLAAPPIWACDALKIHPAHQWEERTESGLRAYRCPGRTVDITTTGDANVTHLHGVRPASWSPEEAHTERMYAPGHSGATRVCGTCGGTWMWAANGPGQPDVAVHTGADGPTMDEGHTPHE